MSWRPRLYFLPQFIRGQGSTPDVSFYPWERRRSLLRLGVLAGQGEDTEEPDCVSWDVFTFQTSGKEHCELLTTGEGWAHVSTAPASGS